MAEQDPALRRWPDSVIARVSTEATHADKCVQALRLLQRGSSQAAVAREVEVAENTVRRWMRRADELTQAKASLNDALLTEDEIARLRARIARESATAGDYKTALEAMRDEGRRQRIEADQIQQTTVSLVADLARLPSAERRRELAERAARLGLTPLHGQLPESPGLPGPEGPEGGGS